MKTVVTGASGFVGRHLMEALQRRGWQAVGLSSRELDLTADPAEVEERAAEILSEEVPDVLFHLAGPKPYSDPATSRKICVEGTAALIRALEGLTRPPRLVAAGSSTEYGHSTEPGVRLSETTEPRPSTPYGAAKLSQTEMVVEAGGVSLRLFNCLGPGQGDDVVAGRIVKQLAEGARRLVLRETASARDFLDVRDAVSAFLLAAESLAPGIYNVCSGTATGIDRLVYLAFEAASVEPLPLVLEQPDARGSYQCGDPSKIESYGWTRRFDLLTSLRDAIEFAKQGVS